MHNLWASYNSNTLKQNFTKRGCESSLDIAVALIILVFPEFLFVSAQRPSEEGVVWIFPQKMNAWAPILFGGGFSRDTTVNE